MKKDHTGSRIGSFTVLGDGIPQKHFARQIATLECQCDCGTIETIRTGTLLHRKDHLNKCKLCKSK